MCIYELMAEESAVNYWEVGLSMFYFMLKAEQYEKYGHVAFDSSQKAVLTSCVLRYKPIPALGTLQSAKDDGQGMTKEEGLVNCCFSFTIRRDRYGIPSMIVGNFIRC